MTPYPDNTREQFLERPLPSSPDSERVILGAILLDNELITQAIEKISADDLFMDQESAIKPDDVATAVANKPHDVSLSDYLEDIEKSAILKALAKANNNKTAAAKLLGVSFRTLRYRLSKLGLSKEDDADLDEES